MEEASEELKTSLRVDQREFKIEVSHQNNGAVQTYMMRGLKAALIRIGNELELKGERLFITIEQISKTRKK